MSAWRHWEKFDPVAHDRALRTEATSSKPRKVRSKAVPSKLEAELLRQIGLCDLPAPDREVRLIPGRKFPWDFVWRAQRLCVEVQGGTWTQGAHSRGAGQSRDAEKQALATLAGWRCLTVTGDQIRSGAAVGWIAQALEMEREPSIGTTVRQGED